MEYLIGVGLALVACAFATLAGFDRDRVFYATPLTVIATYCSLFAVMGSFSCWLWQASSGTYGWL